MDKSKQIGKFTAKIVELFDRYIGIDTKNSNIYINDADNLYPNRLEIIERNSTTANSCSVKLGNFIFGKGFTNNDFEVNTKHSKKIKSNQILHKIIYSLRTHKGVFIHINYDIEGRVNYFDVLDYKKCRIAKEDGLGNKGKIIYKDWDKDKEAFNFLNKNKDNGSWFYPYNNDLKIISDQRENDSPRLDIVAQIKNYRGQVYFLNLDENNIYPHGWLVGQSLNDADSEFRISLYRNNSIRMGFQDKTVIMAGGMDNESANKFESDVQGWLGAENTGNIFVVTSPEMIDNPESHIHTIQLKSSYDSEKFKQDEMAFENSIRKCYLQIPKVLINDNDGGIFGTSGDALKMATEIYSNETGFLRERIEVLFTELFGIENKIIPLYTKEIQ